MAYEAYGPCPCGSGKKFKWCCQPMYGHITKALQQDEAGQHDIALRTMEELVATHPTNPEAWGRQAELLYRNGKLDEAEASLQKAFELNPNYPFGHFLRGVFRRDEGELQGALLLFRKAAELIDPEARDLLGQLWALIADCEMKLNRPVAARAALKIASHCDPADEAFRGALESFDDEKSPLPKCVRREYTFQAPAASLAGDKRAAWDQALGRAATGKLTDVARAFAEVAESDLANAAAWYNLGLARAWLGDNRGAIDALDRYAAAEPDAGKVVNAAALGEVLRFGEGMEEFADILEHSVMYQIGQPEPVSQVLNDWVAQRNLVVMEARQDQPVMTALVLERPVSLAGSPSTRPPRLGAYLMIAGNRLRLWHTNAEALQKVKTHMLQKAGSSLQGEQSAVHVAPFRDALTSALVFPVDVTDAEERQKLVSQELERYFEEVWVHQPLRSLGGATPSAASSQPVLQRKLGGVIQFLEDCAAVNQQPYDFNRLRQKLGLAGGAPALAAAPAAGPAIGSMGTAELLQLAPDQLSDDQLEQAYQAALKQDVRDVAGKFALALVGRPARPDRSDRFPWFTHLVQLSLTEGNADRALDFLNEGEKDDCEHNQGRRRNDYELRRGQVLVKRGSADEGQDVFTRLIERAPSELKFRGTATEAMLSARQGKRALDFAEGGLAKARELNDRDSEQYFLELVEAARRQV